MFKIIVNIWKLQLFFEINLQHYLTNTFVFGTNLSSMETVDSSTIQEYYDGDVDLNFVQKYAWNIWLGIISFHIGFIGKAFED